MLLVCVALLAAVSCDQVTTVQDMITRLYGPTGNSWFSLSLLSGPPDIDGFEIAATRTGDTRVSISGTSGVALASGVNWFMKYYLNNSVTWGVNGTGNNLVLPRSLPSVSQKVTKQSTVKYRYYQNVCTVSYSMAWWDWARWEQELDWMALNGINLPLAFTGQEYVWAQVYTALGLTEADLDEHFAGPAFLAWGRMGNIRGWGGPLNAHWRTQQMQLQLRILARMREFGMTPVLPAFAGHVPKGMKALFPTANISRASDWGGFQDQYCCDYLLAPLDPLFQTIGKAFVKAQTDVYGTGHIYNCDTFNEMDPASSDSTYLKATSTAVYNSMAAADPDAVWLMQGWLFHSGFWTADRMAAYLSGVDNARMIILDLNSEQQPLWKDFVANGKPFVWCMLHNYGGERSIYGNLPLLSSAPAAARGDAGGLMTGIGITMEAIEQNPVAYELFLENAWRSAAWDHVSWVQSYAVRRYGGYSQSAIDAWTLLAKTLYTAGFSWSANSQIVRAPALEMSMNTAPNTTALVDVWQLIRRAASELRTANGPFLYDVVDITRQALSNLFTDMLVSLHAAYTTCVTLSSTFTMYNNADASGNDIERWGNCGMYNPGHPCDITALKAVCLSTEGCMGFNSNGWLKSDVTSQYQSSGTQLYGRVSSFNSTSCRASVADISRAMMTLIADFDTILASNVNYLLGPWIANARRWGATETEAAWLEFNARNQVTLWGPLGEINDYAAKQWSGLVSGYHMRRWQMFFETLNSAVDQGVVPDWTKFDADLLAWGQKWDNGTETYPSKPRGDAVELMRRLVEQYATQKGAYSRTEGREPSSGHRMTAWTRNIAQLSLLCDIDPACKAFTSAGALYGNYTATTTTAGVTLYVKR